jgi:hypothetical protein
VPSGPRRSGGARGCAAVPELPRVWSGPRPARSPLRRLRAELRARVLELFSYGLGLRPGLPGVGLALRGYVRGALAAVLSHLLLGGLGRRRDRLVLRGGAAASSASASICAWVTLWRAAVRAGRRPVPAAAPAPAGIARPARAPAGWPQPPPAPAPCGGWSDTCCGRPRSSTCSGGVGGSQDMHGKWTSIWPAAGPTGGNLAPLNRE